MTIAAHILFQKQVFDFRIANRPACLIHSESENSDIVGCFASFGTGAAEPLFGRKKLKLNRNIMPSRGNIFAAGTKVAAGLTSHQAALRIVHIGDANTTPGQAMQNAINDARTKETLYQSARQGKASAVAEQAELRAAVEEFCLQARDVLKPFLGRTWNEGWSPAGFKNRTLQLPGSLADLCECLRGLKEYFAAHAAHENATANVSSAVAGQKLTALNAAIQTVSDCWREQRAKRDGRDAAEAHLVKLMRKVTSELDAALEPDDVRWLDFIDVLPADTQVPEAVSNLEVDGDGPGLLVAEWSPSVRAERYQVQVLESGRDVEFRLLTTVPSPNADLEGLTPGARVKVRVVAANRAGGSAPSEIVDATVPALANVA